MFAGVGGFREGLTLASENGEFSCVGHCEIDPHANKSYNRLFHTNGEFFCENARQIDPTDLPDFDLLCGGFPCQAFSVAGNRNGFADPRGTLFFELARLAEARHPAYLLFENVPGLLSHDGGKTFAAILHALDKLGYYVEWQVLNSADFGVPQARRRLYIIGTLDARCREKIFPILQAAGAACLQTIPGSQGERVYSTEGTNCTLTAQCGGFGGKTGLYEEGIPIKENTKKCYKMALPGDSIDIAFAGQNSRRGRVGKQIAHTLITESSQATLHFIDLNPNPVITEISRCLTTRQNNPLHKHKGECSGVFVVDSGANAPGTICITSHDGAVRYGRIRRLTPRECLRLQGWRDERIDRILSINSDNQLYKQAGNGVTVTVVEAIGRRIAAMHAELYGEFTEGASLIGGSGVLAWPLPIQGNITSRFGYRKDPFSGKWDFHRGLDIAAPNGTPILAAADGTVVVANATDPWGYSWGYYVKIQHPNGMTTLYAHCSAIAMSAGQQVQKGEVIAYVGSTGASTGNHLHWEVTAGSGLVDAFSYL